jgi:hypothetical protein
MRAKIAAVLHIKWKVTAQRYEATRGGDVFKPIRSGYREYVLCNESMIAEWSMGTPEIVDELRRERDLIRSLSSEFSAVDNPGLTASWTALDFGEIWAKPSTTSPFVDDYARALAFPMVPGYAPTGENLAALARSLDSTLDQGAELRVVPRLPFELAPVAEELRMQQLQQAQPVGPTVFED